jgi:hypothetical protein
MAGIATQLLLVLLLHSMLFKASHPRGLRTPQPQNPHGE